MTSFTGSDYHLNHRQIIKYCPQRVSTSFKGTLDEETAPEVIDSLIVEMNELIINNHNSIVGPDDEVYFLGDMAMGQIKFAPELIRRLNGKKYLVAGNHDKSLVKLISNDDNLSDLFEWIKDYHEMSHALPGGKKNMLCMSHFPMRFWNGKNQGTIMLHGHLHGSYCDVPGRIFDVGIDTNTLFPYKLDDVVRYMSLTTEKEEHHGD